jgi:hypothetical protein
LKILSYFGMFIIYSIGYLSPINTRFYGQMEEMVMFFIDTLSGEPTEILGSMKPLKLDFLRCLAQRWDSPQALLWVCPTLVALLQFLFKLKQYVSR